MKKQVRLLMSFTLILAMLFAAFGVQASDVSDAPQEIVTISYGCSSSIPDGVNEQFSVFNELRDKTGVQLDIVNYDREKFRVLSAGNDLPDMFVLGDATVIEALIENEMVIGLNDLIAQYAPNIAEDFAMAMRYQTLIFGDTYFLPENLYNEPVESQIPVRNAGEGFFTRYDIYKEIGSPEITDSWGGYFDVLEQMQAYAREKYDDDNIYCFSAFTDWGIWPYICMYPFTRGYGDLFDANQMVDRNTNELQDNFLSEDGVFWEGIEYYYEAYRRGLFDPEGLTQKWSQYAEKVQTGKLLVSSVNWLSPDREVCGEEAALILLPNSVAGPILFTPRQLPMGNRFSWALAINAKCKYPERAIQMLNWTNSTDGKRLLVNGVQGETWDYIDGIPQYIGVFKDEYLYSGNWSAYHNDYPSGIYGAEAVELFRAFTSDAGEGIAPDGYPYNLRGTREMIASTISPGEKLFAEEYGCTYPGEVYMKWAEEGKMASTDIYLTMAAQLFGNVDEEISVTESRAVQYFVANVSKPIMAESKEAFEREKAAMIAEMKNMGLEDASLAIKAQFEEALALVEQFQ